MSLLYELTELANADEPVCATRGPESVQIVRKPANPGRASRRQLTILIDADTRSACLPPTLALGGVTQANSFTTSGTNLASKIRSSVQDAYDLPAYLPQHLAQRYWELAGADASAVKPAGLAPKESR